MKKMMVTTLVLGAMIYGSLTDAYCYNISPSEKPSKRTVVTFKGVNSGDKLYIKDTDGKYFYSEKVKTDGTYTKLFDLKYLPENHYYFEMNKAEAITVLPFIVERENITLQNELRKDIPKPQLVARKDQVFLTRDVKDAQSFKVDIYYKGRELVHSEEFDRVGKFLRKYDFSNSRPGQYLFQIRYDDRYLSEYVNVH